MNNFSLEDETHNIHEGIEGFVCRICLENDHVKDLIAPCWCTGSQLYVHRKCLDSWRATKPNERAFTHCSVCTMKYVYQERVEESEKDIKWRTCKYRAWLALDVVTFITLFEIFMFAFSFFLQVCDSRNLALPNAFPSWFSLHLSYWLWAHLIFFAILGLIGLLCFCMGYSSSSSGSSYKSDTWICFCGDSKDGDCGVWIILGILTLIVLVVIGVFVGLFVAVKYIEEQRQKRASILYKQQQTTLDVVQDFSSNRQGLPVPGFIRV
ncbi:MAG: hypothetical protein Sylvanvirus24_5 [Sylvanvirus sp.]|uniref:RING-CH-type domain-containing protein n=1 Tax=Sylvanvirus sp. TaxID=2487774 RepID=A0A3G5AIT5_9VIRU|nr:MAG: hypothetical protein Sylvanvirus24_5 [Sylvanvirus sp.]